MGIRERLALWYGGVFALALALMVLFNYVTYVDEQYRSVDRQMRRGALQFQTEWAQGNPLNLNSFFSENYTIIRRYTAGGQLRDSSHPWLEIPPSNPVQLLEQAPPSDSLSRFRRWFRLPVEAPSGANFVTASINGEHWRLYIYTLRTPNVGYLELMVPLGNIDARMGQVGRNLLLAGLVTLLLMLLIGWAIANRVLRPITRLTRVAQQVAGGSDLSRRVRIPRSNDELSQLALTFNRMMGSLQAEHTQLEDRVKMRTAELEASQNRAEFLATLGDALQALGNPDEVARVAFDRLRLLLGAEYLALSWVGKEQISLGEVWGRLPDGLELAARTGLKRSQGGMLWRMVEGQQALYSNDYAQESYRLELGLHNYAIAAEPVIYRGGEIVAALSIGRIISETGWQESEKDLIKRAANTLGLALERSERLAMAEARVDMAIEATNLGLWSIDLNSGRVTLGGRHAALYGFPPNIREVEIQELEGMVFPGDLPLIQARLKQAIQDLQPYEIEYRIWRRDNGELRWILARGQAIRGVDGVVYRVLGTIIDMTEQHEVLEQIEASIQAERQTATQLEALFDNLPVGLALFDHDLRYVKINPLLAEINQIDAKEHLGETLEQVLPTSSPILRPYLEQVLATGESIKNVELKGFLDHQPGQEAYALASWFPINLDNQTKMVGAVVQDITARKKSEEALRESENHYRATVELNPQVPWTADSQGNITSFTQRWLDMTGLTRDVAFEHGWYSVAHPDDLPQMQAAWAHALSSFLPYDVEHQIRLKDGSYRWMHSRAYPRRNDNGEIISWYGTTEDIHKRKQSEEALRRISDDLQTVLNTVPVGIAISTDPLVSQVQINPAGAVMLGIQPEQNASKNLPYGNQLAFKVLKDGNEVPANQLPMQVAAARGESLGDFDYTVVRSDGSKVDLLEYASPLFDAEGRVRGSVGVFVDITQRKQDEERYHTLFESIEQGFCVIEMIYQDHKAVDYRFIEVNPMFEAQTGLKDAVGRSALELVPNLERKWIETYANIAETGIQRRFEQSSEAMDRWFEVYALRVGDNDSHRVALLFSDISERKRSQDALHQSEQRLEMAVRSGGIGIFDWNIPNDSMHWSDMMYQVFGLEPGQFGGGIEDWGRYHLFEDRERVLAAIQLATQERRERMNFAFRICRANDGALRYIEGTARFIYDATGFAQRMVGVNVDISERAKALEALQESEAKLRTLVESQKRFVADASHELRAPLTSIQGNLELLQRFKNMTADDREIAISEAAREAARLGRLVSDLLALARGDAGMKLQLEPVHLGEVVQEAVSELQHLSGDKQVIAENLSEVRVNAQRDKLKQLAIILLENALKYTPIGGTVRLELHQQQSQAELRVCDNGIGIAPEDLPRVFERFFRADRSRSKSQDPGGTGLGLPIAKWIVEQHGGEIWLESAVEKGTTAVVRLPVLQPDAAIANPG